MKNLLMFVAWNITIIILILLNYATVTIGGETLGLGDTIIYFCGIVFIYYNYRKIIEKKIIKHKMEV